MPDFSFDDEGNTLTRTEIASGEVTEYEWDHRNRLVRIVERTSASGSIIQEIEYIYDAFDQRVGKRIDRAEDGPWPRDDAFVWADGQIVLRLVDSSGHVSGPDFEVASRYLYGDRTDQLLAEEQYLIEPGPAVDATSANPEPGDTFWPLVDHLGSIRDMIDNFGGVREHVVYDGFGNRVFEQKYDGAGNAVSSDHEDFVDTLFGYTGRDWDAEAGLQYNRARWYDPAAGRWLSQDPIGFAAGDANLYRYVENAPTTHTDPTGLSKGRVIGWVVRRVGGKLVKVSAVYTEKQAAQAFAGKCGKYGLDLLMREGRGSADKVARIIQARLGNKVTGDVLGGGSHLGHPIRNLLGQSIGTGTRHIQLDKIPNRHIFYGALAAALGIYATDDAIAGDYSLDLIEVYGDPRPGESFANVFRVGWWCGDDSMAAYLDWVNPGDLLAMGGDFGRHLDREWNKELIGYLITIRDENGEPLSTIAIGPDGEPFSETLWIDGEAGDPIR